MTRRIALLLLAATSSSLDPTLDKYCGTTWTDASTHCRTPCPTGDGDCPDGQECHMLTGCQATLHGELDVNSTYGTNRTERPGRRPTNHTGGKTTQEILPDFLGLDTLLSSSIVVDDSSHGIMFDVETSSDANVLRITHVEFYTSPNRRSDGDDAESDVLDGVAVVMDYQVYIQEGTWREDPSEREYQLVSTGNMTLDDANVPAESTNGLGYARHRIPLTAKIKLDGNGTRYSLYLGLSERVMLYQRPIASWDDTTEDWDNDGDSIPLLQTKDMTIYFGAATMIYPLSKANHPVFYRQPRGFVGRIWYERDACVPSVFRWDECQQLKLPLTEEAIEKVVENGTVYYGGLESDDSGGSAPSASVVPSSSTGPTGGSNRVFLVITFGEAPLGSLMDASGQSSFERVLFDYYTSQDVLSENEVDLYSVKIWYQQFLIKERGNRQMRNSNIGNSPTYTLSDNVDSSTSAPGASLAQYQVTVILSIVHSLLPDVITRDLLQSALSDNMSSFLKSLKLTPSLTPYLQHTGYISSIVAVDELTSPPTRLPTFAPTILITEPIVVREPTPLYIIASILIGTIYTCSIVFSTCYIKRARSEMEYEHGIKVLFQSTAMEDDIRPDTSLLEEKDGRIVDKKRGIGSSFRLSRRKMMPRDPIQHSVNELDVDENESHSWERTSSAEDSSSSSGEEISSEGEKSSTDESESISIT